LSDVFSLSQSFANAASFSVIDRERLKLIAWFAARQVKVAGDFVELGVFRGGSARQLLANQHAEITLRFN
jgi:hypothetical protein